MGGAGRGVTSSFPGSNIHSSSEEDSGGVSAESVEKHTPCPLWNWPAMVTGDTRRPWATAKEIVLSRLPLHVIPHA